MTLVLVVADVLVSGIISIVTALFVLVPMPIFPACLPVLMTMLAISPVSSAVPLPLPGIPIPLSPPLPVPIPVTLPIPGPVLTPITARQVPAILRAPVTPLGAPPVLPIPLPPVAVPGVGLMSLPDPARGAGQGIVQDEAPVAGAAIRAPPSLQLQGCRLGLSARLQVPRVPSRPAKAPELLPQVVH